MASRAQHPYAAIINHCLCGTGRADRQSPGFATTQRNPSRADNSSADESDAVTTKLFRKLKPKPPNAATSGRVERRQWWLSSSSIVVTLLLTAGIVLIALPVMLPGVSNYYSVNTSIGIRGLIGVVLLFDLYLLFQQMQIHRFRKRLAEREELFRLISENAADMIALVDEFFALGQALAETVDLHLLEQ